MTSSEILDSVRTISARNVAQLLGPTPLARPAYRSLATGIRRLVSDGRILVDTRLPSERALMSELGLSRTTVGAALDVLREDGFIVTRRGSGSVTAIPEDRSGLALSGAGLVPTDLPEDVIDLTYAVLPAAPGLTGAYERALEHLPRHLATPGYHPRGLPELRQALADWYEARGLPTDPGDVIVTSGAHAALSAVLRAALDRGLKHLVGVAGARRVALIEDQIDDGQHLGQALADVPALRARPSQSANTSASRST